MVALFHIQHQFYFTTINRTQVLRSDLKQSVRPINHSNYWKQELLKPNSIKLCWPTNA